MNIDVIEDSKVIVYDKRIIQYLEHSYKEVLLAEIKLSQPLEYSYVPLLCLVR
jgi:hypothetical protein